MIIKQIHLSQQYYQQQNGKYMAIVICHRIYKYIKIKILYNNFLTF